MYEVVGVLAGPLDTDRRQQSVLFDGRHHLINFSWRRELASISQINHMHWDRPRFLLNQHGPSLSARPIASAVDGSTPLPTFSGLLGRTGFAWGTSEVERIGGLSFDATQPSRSSGV